MKKQMIVYITILMVGMFLSGCLSEEGTTNIQRETGNQSSGDHKSLTVLFSFASSSLDPHQDWMPVPAGMAETLVKVDENLEIQPWLAESWEQIDERTWVFNIREGVKFHDGTSVDAEAVKASFERAMEVNRAVASTLKIEDMEATGQALTFITSEPYPALLTELVHTNTAVIKVDAEDIGTQPIATGPFKVTDFTPQVEIQLERFEDYWDGMPNLNEVTVTFNSDSNVRSLALQSGEADIAFHLSPEALEPVELSEDLRIESITSLRAHFLLYNMQHPALQDHNVRKALDLIVNRPVMVREIMNGHGTQANGPYNPDLPFATEQAGDTYDPSLAEALLIDAGYDKNEAGFMQKDGEPLSFTLATYQGRPELPVIAQYLQSEAAAIGVDMNVVTVENIESYLWEQQDEWDIVTYSNMTAPRGDGGYFLNVAYGPDGSLNPGHIHIPELNDIRQQLNATADREERVALQQAATAIIQDEILHSFMLYPHIIVGVHERVTNWRPGAVEYYIIDHKMDVAW
ncbi:nickel ABC transporter substrate-binding protein [Caldalkalibacillus salinus]|uniref:nickel ABC transporter substrate-binding protein n=1 Tax=Caldalkalibacillus salinus TaxID=2803787 RepID=UPI0019236DCE|nr:nickel ABC transporter substrate-binding protein [Caldalkalibacillus salinus]